MTDVSFSVFFFFLSLFEKKRDLLNTNYVHKWPSWEAIHQRWLRLVATTLPCIVETRMGGSVKLCLIMHLRRSASTASLVSPRGASCQRSSTFVSLSLTSVWHLTSRFCKALTWATLTPPSPFMPSPCRSMERVWSHGVIPFSFVFTPLLWKARFSSSLCMSRAGTQSTDVLGRPRVGSSGTVSPSEHLSVTLLLLWVVMDVILVWNKDNYGCSGCTTITALQEDCSSRRGHVDVRSLFP